MKRRTPNFPTKALNFAIADLKEDMMTGDAGFYMLLGPEYSEWGDLSRRFCLLYKIRLILRHILCPIAALVIPVPLV